MSSAIQAGEQWRAIVGCYEGGEQQVSLNRFDYYCSNVTGAPTLDDTFALYLSIQLSAIYFPLLAADATFYGVKLYRVYPSPTFAPVTNTAYMGPGTAGAFVLPTQTCGLVTRKSSAYGRSGIGRIYLPFPSVDSNVDGIPTAAYVAQAVLLATAARTTVSIPNTGGTGTITMVPIINNRTLANSHPPPKTTPVAPIYPLDVIVDTYASGRWATQRRRGNFGRTNQIPPF
jgi:hypothetical protein